MVEIDAIELMSRTTVSVKVKVRRARELRIRAWLANILIQAAGVLLNAKEIEVVLDHGQGDTTSEEV
jgi:hypothetical protein